MTSFLLKKEIKMALFFALLFCAAVYFYQNNRYKSFTNYMDEAERYIDTYFGEDEEAFYEKLEEDLMYCFRQQDDIDRFVGYEGQLPENSQGSNYAIVPLDAMLWQQQQRNQPGRFTDTVWEDLAMLSSLRSAMQGMRNLSHNIENSKEIMRREMRRQDEEVFKYAACMKAYEAFDAMEKEVANIEPTGVAFFLESFEQDYMIFILFALLNFGVFATAIQKKRSDAIVISQMGMKKYTRKRLVVGWAINTAVYIMYMLLLVLIVGGHSLSSEKLSAPLQIFSGYETAPLPVSVGEYLLILIGLRYLLCMLLCSLVCLISLVSRRTIIALIGGLLLVAVQIIVASMKQDIAMPSWLIASFGATVMYMIQHLPYVDIFGQPVLYIWVYGVGLSIGAVLVSWVTVKISHRVVLR